MVSLKIINKEGITGKKKKKTKEQGQDFNYEYKGDTNRNSASLGSQLCLPFEGEKE
jgi:hypothetical protein